VRIRESYGIEYDVGKVLSIIYCIFWSCEKLNRLSVCVKKIYLGKSAALKIF
jgi:hypothetical protein